MYKMLMTGALAVAAVGAVAQESERFAPFKVIESSKAAWGNPAEAADGNWQSVFTTKATNADGSRAEHFVTIDLGKREKVSGFVYIPNPHRDQGRVKDYRIYVSDTTANFGEPVIKGELAFTKSSFWPEAKEKFSVVKFPAAEGRYVKFVSLSDHKNSGETAIAEFVPITNPDSYAFKDLSMVMLKGLRMAPSVHLNYGLHNANAYYLEMTPKTNPPGSYYMAIGFSNGYYGIQEQSNGKRVALFSVWDSHETDNPNVVPEEKRVKVLYADTAMIVRRFGGEGVGVQSFYPLDWNVDSTYKFLVKIDYLADSNLTVYTSWLFDPAVNHWRRLTSLGRPGTGKHLSGFHSFAEDFRRNFESYRQNRLVEFRNMWALDATTNEWIQPKRLRFTVDGNPRRNIDAGPLANGGFLSTGGDITNKTIKVHSAFPFEPLDTPKPPQFPQEILKPTF